MTRQHQDCGCSTPREPCAEFPALVRMNYFHGQLITERDFKTEQAYFRERLRHMNRCLHGYGIVCGLGVSPRGSKADCIDEPDAAAKDLKARLADVDQRMEDIKKRFDAAEEPEARAKLEAEYKALAAQREEIARQIEAGQSDGESDGEAKDDPHCSAPPPPLHTVEIGCGAAIDCLGNDLIVRHPVALDLAGMLPKSGQRQLADGQPVEAWLMVCHAECGVEPARPYATDTCATGNACVDSRVREDVRFELRLEAPQFDERCETCCTSCIDPCLLLARVRLDLGRPVREADIDLSDRRPLGLYHPVTITGVSWEHGASYDAKSANLLLGTKDPDGGLVIRFSREVRVSSLLPGVVEVWRLAGGRGVSGIVTSVEGELADLPADGFVSEVRFRDTTGETVQARDRILVTVRGDFILDRCCRPVAAANIGGRVPALPGGPEPKDRPDRTTECRHPPMGRMPWTSGHGGLFESWFSVAED